MSRLNEKVALISGGTRGIGFAIARAMLAEGAKVVIGDILDSDGQKIAEELGADVTYVHLDVSNPDDWQNAVETTVKTYGKLNVLVNNAGISDKTPINESTPETTSIADWDKVIAVNLKGPFLGIKYALPVMKENGGGSIINISSIAALIGTAGPFAYTASKGGVRSMTKNVAVHYAAYNIRANSIHPGGVKTPMIMNDEIDEETNKKITSMIPMGRISEPVEIANLVVFLASDESSYMTGSEVVIDGGLTIA